MHIAFVASECVPFSKTGGLADVVGALPRSLAAAGHQISVFLPRYRQTKLADAKTVVRSVTIPFDDRYRFCSVVTESQRSRASLITSLNIRRTSIAMGFMELPPATTPTMRNALPFFAARRWRRRRF